ncbi:MAG: hypothetical protein HYY55_02495 [Candidatus Niyogibacteria bacterium]|nr:MAG: hypothetical protein HYY55_02495 [Candidatus Niyogibacteria bacterium]
MKLFNFSTLKPFNSLTFKLFNLLTFISLGFIVAVFLPSFALAQQPLVPCGGPGQPCTFCHLMELANRVVKFGFNFLILPLAALGILASGLTLLTAGGSQTQLEKGKSMLKAIIIGFFIAVSAWVIINTILGTLVQEGQFFNPLTEPFPACVTPRN